MSGDTAGAAGFCSVLRAGIEAIGCWAAVNG
jgi:hypothetical protein